MHLHLAYPLDLELPHRLLSAQVEQQQLFRPDRQQILLVPQSIFDQNHVDQIEVSNFVEERFLEAVHELTLHAVVGEEGLLALIKHNCKPLLELLGGRFKLELRCFLYSLTNAQRHAKDAGDRLKEQVHC